MKLMQLKDAIQQDDRDYDYIEYRYHLKRKNGQVEDIFVGACSYKDGEIISLDGDDYSLEDYIESYEIREKDMTVYVL